MPKLHEMHLRIKIILNYFHMIEIHKFKWPLFQIKLLLPMYLQFSLKFQSYCKNV